MAPGEKTTGGKTDMERIGLFQEMEYVTIGDKYKMAGKSEFFVFMEISVLILILYEVTYEGSI